MSLREALGLLDEGGAAAMRGDHAAAERAFARAVALAPEVAEAHYNLGLVLQETGRPVEAAERYREAIARRAAFPEAHNNLGNLLRAEGRLESACEHYARALGYNPGLAPARANLAAASLDLGIAHQSQGAWDLAQACFERVVALQPDSADAHNNLGQLLQDREDLAGAAARYERALELDPRHADAIHNLGFLRQEQGRRDEAMEHYRRALSVNASHGRAKVNLGYALLERGDFAGGWPLLEARFETQPPITPRRSLALPPFSAEDRGQGRRVALWKEQGLGEQLLFATLLPQFEARGEAFVLEVDARLVAAFRRSHPHWTVTAPEESAAAFAACDRQLAIGSLAGLMRPDAASFAAQPERLITADAALERRYRERLGQSGRVIGISWRSFQPRSRGKHVRAKSAALAVFAPLSARAGVRLLDLQYGDTAEERAAFAAAGGRLDRLEGLDLFADLEGVLAAIAACDVVVTTSNVTAHLAGALGKRTLLVYLRGVAPFHYWVPGPGGRCRWYPSVEIVSAPDTYTWQQALANVEERLG